MSSDIVRYGQIVIGSPGSGKTTYCHGLQMFCEQIQRPCALINLDFANDNIKYKALIDVRELITLEEAMEKHILGPNGGLIYCMEYLLENIEWLIQKIQSIDKNCQYLLIDCPGQVELYTHHTCVQEILHHLQNINCRLCSVFTVDSFYCCDVSSFLAVALLVSSTMMRLALPHISVLTKVDLMQQYGKTPITMDYFMDMQDTMMLSDLLPVDSTIIDDTTVEDVLDINKEEELFHKQKELQQKLLKQPMSFSTKYQKLSASLGEVLDDLGILYFHTLDIQDKQLLFEVLKAADTANGYGYAIDSMETLQRLELQISPIDIHTKQVDSLCNITATNIFKNEKSYRNEQTIQEKCK